MTADRFSRQTILPEIGESGQRRLKESSVLVVGCGGLGSALLYCLCGMGICYEENAGEYPENHNGTDNYDCSRILDLPQD